MSHSLSRLSSSSNPAALAAAATAMGELGVAGCIGAACVQQEIITPDMVKALSKTIFYVLLPMFIGTAIMKTTVTTTTTRTTTTVTAAAASCSRKTAFFLAVPILAALQAAIMFVLSRHILIPLFLGDMDDDNNQDTTCSDHHQGKTKTNMMAVTCCFGNAGVLPFVFAESMFRDNALLLEQAYSQVSLFSAGWSPFFWSLVPKVLGISPSSTTSTSSNDKNEANDSGNNTLRVVMGRFFRDHLQVFFPPPVVGVVAGLLIGLCPPLSSLLLSSSGAGGAKNNSNAPPLAIIYNSFQNLGKAANPLAVLVLACSLAFGVMTNKKQESSSPSSCAATTRTSSLFQKKWACVSLARFVISPLVMLALLWILSSSSNNNNNKMFHLIPSSQDAPMLWFICLLEAVMPPAQNSVVLLQVAGRPRDAEEMATFLFSIYATSMLPIVVLITILLQSLQLLVA